jgi:hypothetical protein
MCFQALYIATEDPNKAGRETLQLDVEDVEGRASKSGSEARPGKMMTTLFGEKLKTPGKDRFSRNPVRPPKLATTSGEEDVPPPPPPEEVIPPPPPPAEPIAAPGPTTLLPRVASKKAMSLAADGKEGMKEAMVKPKPGGSSGLPPLPESKSAKQITLAKSDSSESSLPHTSEGSHLSLVKGPSGRTIREHIFQNGDRYTGEWERGKMHGQGIYKFASDGSHYEGEFTDGRMNGYGVYVDAQVGQRTLN